MNIRLKRTPGLYVVGFMAVSYTHLDVYKRQVSVSEVIAYSPAGVAPWPLVGASSFIRSTVRCRGMYCAR